MGEVARSLYPAPAGDGTVWAVPFANALDWQEFDGEFLIYNSASGQTHHLNLLAGEALRSLEAEPGRLHELVSRLANRFEIAEESPPLLMIDRLIRELDELGLIAPSAS
ncbi:MAG: HPr-rel-A system PqqD family peptide chaperone [Acetobacteraceae bacterium]|nr:HPr-rel-A system PqqD family peptide chaperone [Acetobacteraceae bacterium]